MVASRFGRMVFLNRLASFLPDYDQHWSEPAGGNAGTAQVIIAGIERPGNRQALTALWQPIRRLRAEVRRRDLTANERQSYGLTEQQHIRLDDGRAIFWGSRDNRTWLYRQDADGTGALVAAAASLASRLNQHAARLDQLSLLPADMNDVFAAQINDHQFVWQDKQWQWRHQPDRPAVSGRLRELITHLQSVNVNDVTVNPTWLAGLQLTTITIYGDDVWQLRGAITDQGPHISLNQGIAQPVGWSWWLTLQVTIQQLPLNFPYQIDIQFMDSLVTEAEIWQDGELWYRLRRDDFYDQLEGQSTWRLRMEDQVFVADHQSGETLLTAFNNLKLSETWKQAATTDRMKRGVYQMQA